MSFRTVSTLLVAALVIVALDAHAAKATVIQDIEAIQLAGQDYRPLSAAEVRAAVTSAATSLGWTVSAVNEQAINLRLEKSSDRASYWVEIQIPYADGAFALYYVDSDGLQFRERGARRVIHGSYKRWIDNLVGAILRAAAGTLPVNVQQEKPD